MHARVNRLTNDHRIVDNDTDDDDECKNGDEVDRVRRHREQGYTTQHRDRQTNGHPEGNPCLQHQKQENQHQRQSDKRTVRQDPDTVSEALSVVVEDHRPAGGHLGLDLSKQRPDTF